MPPACVPIHRCSTVRRAQVRLRGARIFYACACACAAVLATADAKADPARVAQLAPVRILSSPLLPGSGLLLRTLPANAQVLGGEELRRDGTANLGGFLERRAAGVTANSAQGNPFQTDIVFRGFTASPLLGTPQGVSVFVDGARINEAFGDVVNWDLLPPSAIASIQVVPGSNPAFGLNTIGGAFALYTRRGAIDYPDEPGGSLAASTGSFGRRTLVGEAGGRDGRWDWFATADALRDDGWAQHNPSRLRRAFGKLGWRDGSSDVEWTLSGADNRLEGIQALPASFQDIREPYTYPDINRNRVVSASMKAMHALSDALIASGHLHLRRLESRNTSSNVEADFEAVGSVAAVNDASRIRQRSAGAGIQLEHSGSLGGLGNRFVVGASIDHGRIRFTRMSQQAAFTADRGTIGLGEFEPDTDADSTTRYLGAFVSNVIDLGERWTLTIAGRTNHAWIRVADRSGDEPALDGAHRFHRFNPAVGITYSPVPAWTAWAGYNEGMRVPTAMELTCADPDAPCRLPNSFVADPPLKAVTSTTVEAGVRGNLASGPQWSAAVFRTDLHDDLQFIASGASAVNAGYFRNVGRTRRQGLELGVRTRTGPFALALQYGYLDAKFATGFVANSPGNSSADADGAIVVSNGDRIPGIPRHTLKLRVDVTANARWTVGADAHFASGVLARGDENNRDVHGALPGYVVLNVGTRFRLDAQLSVFARIDNVFDRRYANFAILGNNVFTGPGASFDAANPRVEQFLGHGAPRGAWVGVEYRY